MGEHGTEDDDNNKSAASSAQMPEISVNPAEGGQDNNNNKLTGVDRFRRMSTVVLAPIQQNGALSVGNNKPQAAKSKQC